MGLEAPPWAAETFHVLTGDGWPAVDEDQLTALADVWFGIAAELTRFAPEVRRSVEFVASSGSLVGEARTALQKTVDAVTSPDGVALENLAAGFEEMGSYLRQVALQTGYLKIMVIEELIVLAAEIVYLITMIPWTFGASAAGIAGLTALGQTFARQLVRQLAIAILANEVLQVGMDVIAQLAQMAQGRRGLGEWDASLTKSTAITGLVGGLLGPVFQGLGHYPGKLLGNAFGVVMTKNVSHELSDWGAGVLKAGLHEWTTDGLSGFVQNGKWKPDTFSVTAGVCDQGVMGAAGLGRRKGGSRFWLDHLRLGSLPAGTMPGRLPARSAPVESAGCGSSPEAALPALGTIAQVLRGQDTGAAASAVVTYRTLAPLPARAPVNPSQTRFFTPAPTGIVQVMSGDVVPPGESPEPQHATTNLVREETVPDAAQPESRQHLDAREEHLAPTTRLSQLTASSPLVAASQQAAPAEQAIGESRAAVALRPVSWMSRGAAGSAPQLPPAVPVPGPRADRGVPRTVPRNRSAPARAGDLPSGEPLDQLQVRAAAKGAFAAPLPAAPSPIAELVPGPGWFGRLASGTSTIPPSLTTPSDPVPGSPDYRPGNDFVPLTVAEICELQDAYFKEQSLTGSQSQDLAAVPPPMMDAGTWTYPARQPWIDSDRLQDTRITGYVDNHRALPGPFGNRGYTFTNPAGTLGSQIAFHRVLGHLVTNNFGSPLSTVVSTIIDVAKKIDRTLTDATTLPVAEGWYGCGPYHYGYGYGYGCGLGSGCLVPHLLTNLMTWYFIRRGIINAWNWLSGEDDDGRWRDYRRYEDPGRWAEDEPCGCDDCRRVGNMPWGGRGYYQDVEAEQRERAERREAERRERAERREAEAEAARREEAERREAEQKQAEAERQEAEAARREEAERREEAALREEAERREAELLEAARREVEAARRERDERREAERRERAERHEAKLRERAERREAERREAEAARREAEAARRERDERKQAERREKAERQLAERRERVERRQAEAEVARLEEAERRRRNQRRQADAEIDAIIRRADAHAARMQKARRRRMEAALRGQTGPWWKSLCWRNSASQVRGQLERRLAGAEISYRARTEATHRERTEAELQQVHAELRQVHAELRQLRQAQGDAAPGPSGS